MRQADTDRDPRDDARSAPDDEGPPSATGLLVVFLEPAEPDHRRVDAHQGQGARRCEDRDPLGEVDAPATTL